MWQEASWEPGTRAGGGGRTHLLRGTGPFPNDLIHNNPKHIPEQGFCSHGVPVAGAEWFGVSHQEEICEQSRSYSPPSLRIPWARAAGPHGHRGPGRLQLRPSLHCTDKGKRVPREKVSKQHQVGNKEAAGAEQLETRGHCLPKARTRGLPSHSGLRSGGWRQGTQPAFESVRISTAEGVRYRQQSHGHEITLVTLALKRT